MKMIHSLLAVTLLAAALLRPAVAADDELAQRVAACTREHDDARRLACFDRAAAPQAAIPKVKEDQSFGVHGSELARSRDDDNPQARSAPKRIAATVAAIEK